MRARLGLVVAAALLLAGCGDARPASSPSASASPSGSASARPHRPAPVHFGSRIWHRKTGHNAPDSQPYAVIGIRDIEATGGLLVYTGPNRSGSHDRLVVADLATGAPRWSKVEFESIGVAGKDLYLHDGRHSIVVGSGAHQLLLAEYIADDDSQGVAALSAVTGKVQWTLPTGPDGSLVAADDRMVLLDDSSEHRSRAVAYDLATRHQLWEAPGVVPVAIVDGTLLGDRSSGWSDRTRTVVGLDPKTGHKRWELAGAHSSSVGRTSTGSVALAHVGDNAVVVDPATGHSLASVATDKSCLTDGESVVACPGTEHGAPSVIALSDGKAAVHPVRSEDIGQIFGVVGGLVYASSSTGMTLLDKTAREYSTRPPGRLAAAGSGYVVFSDNTLSSDDLELSAYRPSH